MEHTICGISTANGQAGIGIVRMSGENAIKIGNSVFKEYKTEKKEHRIMRYGWILDDNNLILDEVMFVEMHAPNTYTKEDMVEIYTHGGNISTRLVLKRLMEQGAKLAEGGEFTKRAFLNGRIDLVQAESVINLIKSKTEAEYKASLNLLKGEFTEEIRGFTTNLIAILSTIEMIINFTEDIEDEIDINPIVENLDRLENDLAKLLKNKNKGKILREGIETTILGKPNVGKSSLLNLLLKENRAIVTDIPGTTRDINQEYIDLDGILLKINDTAGIRDTTNIVEKIGIDKTLELINSSDLIIFILDINTGITLEDEKIFDLIKDKHVIVLLNKIDLESNLDKSDVLAKLPKAKIIETSMLEKQGIEELIEKISEEFETGNIKNSEEIILTNLRQTNLLEEAYTSIKNANSDIKSNIPIECVEVDLKSALIKLGEITGDNFTEDVIDKVFKDFCIGK